MRVMLGLLACCLSGLTSAQSQWGGELASLTTKDAAGNLSTLSAVVWKPSVPSKGGVVLVHGSGGWGEHREGHYGSALSAAGYTVIAFDAFGSRGVGSTVEDQSRVTSFQMTLDAFAARRYLLGLGVASDKTAVAGFSKGGSVALFAADKAILSTETERFAVAVPFYPGCTTRSAHFKPASKMLMLIGAKDDWTGVPQCQDWAARYTHAGGEVSVKIYPGAGHGFDGDPRYTNYIRLPQAETYTQCVVEVADDGTRLYGGKSFALLDDEGIFKAMRSTCVKKGATVWTDLSVKKQATSDFIAFLNQTIGR